MSPVPWPDLLQLLNSLIHSYYSHFRSWSPEGDKSSTLKSWDVFRVVNKKKSRDMDDIYLNISKKIVKVVVCIFLSLAILLMTMLSKSALFLITSNIYTNITLECTWVSETEVQNCVRVPADRAKSDHIHPSQAVQVRWLWALYIVVCTPCVFTFCKCLWRMCFKKTRNPTLRVLLLVCICIILKLYFSLFRRTSL